MELLKEDFERLQELIRKVNSLISPSEYHDDLKWLLNRDMSKKMMETKPDCFLAIKRGNSGFYLPVCNRMGMTDPRIIAFSLKMVDRLAKDPDVSEEDLNICRFKLQRLMRLYDKEVPTPPRNSYRKGVTTKDVNRIKQAVKGLKGE